MLNLSLSGGFRDHAECHIDRTGTAVNLAQVRCYSLIQKNGDTFATVYRSECVTVFLNQTIFYV